MTSCCRKRKKFIATMAILLCPLPVPAQALPFPKLSLDEGQHAQRQETAQLGTPLSNDLNDQACAEPKDVPAPPAYKLLRYEEDYSYLKDPTRRTDFWDPIKYMPLGG